MSCHVTIFIHYAVYIYYATKWPLIQSTKWKKIHIRQFALLNLGKTQNQLIITTAWQVSRGASQVMPIFVYIMSNKLRAHLAVGWELVWLSEGPGLNSQDWWFMVVLWWSLWWFYQIFILRSFKIHWPFK